MLKFNLIYDNNYHKAQKPYFQNFLGILSLKKNISFQ